MPLYEVQVSGVLCDPTPVSRVYELSALDEEMVRKQAEELFLEEVLGKYGDPRIPDETKPFLVDIETEVGELEGEV